jgi:N-acetylneuraminate synthase/N,N'-diacetyllegionaminate synthase
MVTQMLEVDIADRKIGAGHPCFVIAEAGVNHNGDMGLARELVRQAKACGADSVKFQTFTAENAMTRTAPKAAYQLRVTDPSESQFEMVKALELSEEAHVELIQLCASEGIMFLSTPYGFDDARLLHRLGVPAFKIASALIIELSFLEFVARFGKPMIVSTGMATLDEVRDAVNVIRSTGNDQVVLLQCTTNYPSLASDANLRSMRAMAQSFGCVVGYSDHTIGIAVTLASVALGATMIEKHFTLDRSLPGPDHSCSADASELREMIRGIRDVESAMGTDVKRPTESERLNIPGLRRSIVAAFDIPQGTRLEPEMLAFKRPGTGISPARLTEVVGRITRVAITADTLLSFEQMD